MQNEKETKTGDEIYLSLKRNATVEKTNIHVKDIGEVFCGRKDIENKVKEIVVTRIEPPKTKVLSALYVIEQIENAFPGKVILSVGETDVIVGQKIPRNNRVVEGLKVAFISLVLFFGSAFTIMSFQGDAGVEETFGKFYYQMTGVVSDGVTVLEISYSIGIAVGILLFFNHISGKKVTPQPTPVQVQMREYEKKMDFAFIENVNRKGTEESVE